MTAVSTPNTTAEAMARSIRSAAETDTPVAIRGAGTWQEFPENVTHLDATTLTSHVDIAASDLVVTASASTRVADLQTRLAEHDVWFAVDAPGPDRTLGSLVSTGTSGPLTLGYGPIRDQVLGMTFVTGSGQVLRLGGSVVKNVAGFDLIRLVTGAFGAYGMITSVTVRLRAQPAADVTIRTSTSLEDAMAFFDALQVSRLTPSAAIAATTPAGGCDLTIRLTGSDPHVRLLVAQLNDVTSVRFDTIEPAYATDIWRAIAKPRGPCSLRVSSSNRSHAAATEIVQSHLGNDLLISPTGLRWTGSTEAAPVLAVRKELEKIGCTSCLERAPVSVLARTGHYPRAIGPTRTILDRLQRTFDPSSIMVTHLEAPHD